MMSRFKTLCTVMETTLGVPSLSLQQNAASLCFQCAFPCSSCIRHDKNSSQFTDRLSYCFAVVELRWPCH